MRWFKSSSLESYINFKLTLFTAPIPLTAGLWLWLENISWLSISLIEIVIVFVLWLSINSFRERILKAFERANLHLEAIDQDDYNQYAKAAFSEGKVKEFHQQLNCLSQKLQQKKSRYDQHVFLIYQLIEQLDTPILVFNQKQQLVFGNEAFQQLFSQPWQMLRHASAKLLGLEKSESLWQFNSQFKPRNNSESEQQQWQIRQSEFIESGENHQLLVFINIGSALRESQLNAWQQIIRVLGHEIRNSLTPVSSLAESLTERTTAERDKKALAVISERCQHLQDFVDSYASLSKKMQLSKQWIALDELTRRISGLFQGLEISIDLECDRLWADGIFIEQVLINLIKNSQEAEATKIKLSFSESNQMSVIQLIDNGHGFANLENLFVPLYTTKPLGQGIGLSFCRNIIEQHEGAIKLENNSNRGVVVSIQLPLS